MAFILACGFYHWKIKHNKHGHIYDIPELNKYAEISRPQADWWLGAEITILQEQLCGRENHAGEHQDGSSLMRALSLSTSTVSGL